MKSNIKKLVLALGVGLVIGGSALAFDSPNNKNQLVTVVTMANGDHASMNGATDTAINICQGYAGLVNAAGGWHLTTLDARTILNKELSSYQKEIYPNATMEARLECTFFYKAPNKNLADHTGSTSHIAVVW